MTNAPNIEILATATAQAAAGTEVDVRPMR
jgi:hypothetical protein